MENRLFYLWFFLCVADALPVKVSVLVPLTGTASVQAPVADALTMAAEEINQGGGILFAKDGNIESYQ
jgi:ABC-type branched-subunit amino acid transport system substrate-binding protein